MMQRQYGPNGPCGSKTIMAPQSPQNGVSKESMQANVPYSMDIVNFYLLNYGKSGDFDQGGQEIQNQTRPGKPGREMLGPPPHQHVSQASCSGGDP